MTDPLRISETGAYTGISEDAYHADPVVDPSFSCSLAKILLGNSPRHAWQEHSRLNPGFQPTDKETFDIGKMAHSLMLGDPRRFAVIDAKDWRTNAAKEARDEARKNGKTPILAPRWPEVQAMVDAGRAQLLAHEDANDAFREGKPEVTLIWKEGDVWCRCRLDWMPDGDGVFYDYKSTGQSANPDAFERTFYNMGYDIQLAFYRRGIRAVLGISNPVFEFVVQEVSPPYALSVIGAPPSVVDIADRKVDEALRWWGWCMKNKVWPGYPGRTVYIGMPVYAEKAWLDREERDNLAREGNPNALFEIANRWQAPLD